MEGEVVVSAPMAETELGAERAEPGRQRCVTSLPPIAAELPPDARLAFTQYVNTCDAPRWIIGFEARITASWALRSRSIRVEHYTFVWRWRPSPQR
jgi:hypothetical protein